MNTVKNQVNIVILEQNDYIEPENDGIDFLSIEQLKLSFDKSLFLFFIDLMTISFSLI